MVCKNLDARADDEGHEEQVQEVLQPQPDRKSRSDGLDRLRNARISHDEILHGWQFAQGLGYSNGKDQQHERDRHGPKNVDPTLANSNSRHHACLRRQPVIQANTIIS